ncbi:hypothetical protein B0H21DRAFT_781763 [Amylocystis lapponica]|nr:hypothetical protein B0H21DRAFT_781763 [Amylocystis lapponica]
MSWLPRFRADALSWWHGVPLPAEPDAPFVFQTWHTFDGSTVCWVPYTDTAPSLVSDGGGGISDKTSAAQLLELVTWNVDSTSAAPEARIAALELQTFRDLGPLRYALVSRRALSVLLEMPWVREAWLTSEADASRWEGQSFASMTLLSKARFGAGAGPTGETLGPLWRVKYPSRFGRYALCCDVLILSSWSSAAALSSSPSCLTPTRVRLVNVHLDSLPINPSRRPRQLAVVASYLRAVGRGLVAGDFNPVMPEDHGLVGANGLVDAWEQLMPTSDGYTWGVDDKAPFPPSRLDKVVSIGLKAREIQVLEAGVQYSAKPHKEGRLVWSDHAGIRCRFEVAG